MGRGVVEVLDRRDATPVAGGQIDQKEAFAVPVAEKLQVVPALPRLVVGARLVLEREAERTIVGRNVHRDVDAPALREPAALLHDPDLVGGGGSKSAETLPPGRRCGAPATKIMTEPDRITHLGSNPQQLQNRFQKGHALAVLAGRIEEVGDDPREAEFVAAEVAEDVEAVREMAIGFALDRAGRVQMRSQFLQETDGILAPGPPHVVQMMQEFGDRSRRRYSGPGRCSGLGEPLTHDASLRPVRPG